MLTYRKKSRLRVRRFDVPEPPFFAAELIEPYAAAPTGGLVFDWRDLAARAVASGDASVATRRAAEATPSAALDYAEGSSLPRAIVDATPSIEPVFDAASAFKGRATILRSLDSRADENEILVFWPPDVPALSKCRFRGLIVPVMFPVTTDLEILRQVIEASPQAEFIAAATIELDAPAKRHVSDLMSLSDDDERYETLFHDDLEPIATATERHIAALAAEAGKSDHVALPAERSNWNAAARLALAGSRLVKMGEMELGLTILRSARVVAATDKALLRVAASASLSIIEGLDEISSAALGEWLETGQAPFLDEVDGRWRLRRDYSPAALDEEP